MKPLYSDIITTNTKDEQPKSFSLARHKELKTPLKAEVKQFKHSLSQHNDWTAFCRALVSKSIKNHIESGLLEQKTWTESRNRTNPHVELKLGGSYHQHTKMLQPTGKRTKNGSFLHFESLQRKIFSKRTVASLVTPCFVRHKNRLSLFSDGPILSDVVLTSSGQVWTSK